MAKETIYLTENVRLSGAEEDSPRGAEVSVNKTEADFLVDVAKVATREKPKQPGDLSVVPASSVDPSLQVG